jgi:RNA polymerase sigma-70 factor (ECF subfamily)
MLQPDSDDVALIERSLRGDLGAFNRIVETYQRQVYSLCLRMLGSVQAAEDVTQETFFSAYRHLASFKGEAFRPWLFRIASNACTDELRRRKRRPTVSIEPDDPASDPLPIPDTSEGPEAYALRMELRETIESALLVLPEDQRLAILLCDVQGFSYDEIAVTMNVAVGTVKSRINRARSRLRELLAREREPFAGSGRPS